MARTLRAAPSVLRIAIRFLAGAPRRAIKRMKLTQGRNAFGVSLFAAYPQHRSA